LTVGSDLASSAVSADVDLATVDTGNADRDGHLKAADFFNVERNPTMSFRSSAISGGGEDYELVGDLTINGVTHPTSLEVEFLSPAA